MRSPVRGEVVGENRRQCVIDGGGCNFVITDNPNADGSKPWYELPGYSLSDDYASDIEAAAQEVGIDAKLLRAIVYVESTHGWYDFVGSWLGLNRSLLPANVNVDYWGDAFGSRAFLSNPYNNIRAAAIIVRGIEANLPADAPVSHIATLYNNLDANTVSDYGARVSSVYHGEFE